MRKRIHIGLVALFVAAVGAIAWRGFASREPSYQGRPLSAWMQDLSRSGMGPISPSVRNALRHFGRDALPQIISDLRSRDSSLQYPVCKWANDHHLIKAAPLPARYRHNHAILACMLIGPDAKAAVPALSDLLNEAGPAWDSPPAFDSAIIMAHINEPETVSALLNLSSNTNAGDQLRIYVAICLRFCESNAPVVVPGLIRLLQDSNNIARFCAAYSLGEIRKEPRVAVPALTAALADADREVRLYSCSALGNFTNQAQAAIEPLLDVLNAPDADFRERAAIALAHIDSHNPSTVARIMPLLIEGIRGRAFANEAIEALGQCGSLARPAVPMLLECLNETRPPERDIIVKALRSIDPQINILPVKSPPWNGMGSKVGHQTETARGRFYP